MNGHSPCLLRSRRIITPHGEIDGAVEVRGETITGLFLAGELPTGIPVEDLGTLALLPGLIDAHVHINEPGRTSWEGYATATRAALAGGITSLLDMPLNSSPVGTSAEALRFKRAATHGKLSVDVGYYAGLVAGNGDLIREMLNEGSYGVKAFLCPSGLDDFPAAGEADLRQAMPQLAAAGVPLLVHAELPEPAGIPPARPQSHAAWLASRPPEVELRAIELLLRLARETGCAVHIVHLSTAQALPMLSQARHEGLPITVETCPHYLVFAAEDVPDGDTRFKCAPPIRDRTNREGLWQGLRDGVITRIGSDHSPCPPSMKALQSGDFFQAWGGISSLQVSLPAVWSEARQRGFSLSDVCRWMATHPAKELGLADRGAIAIRPGSPPMLADLVAFDSEASFVVRGSDLLHRHSVTPYEGRVLTGVVRKVWKRGSPAYVDGTFSAPAQGRLLFRWSPGLAVPVDSPDADRLLPLDYPTRPVPRPVLDRLNALPFQAAREAFLRCCGHEEWARRMADARPYADSSAILATAEHFFREVFGGREDWLQAFSHHPRIGDMESLRKKFAATAVWAGQEQSGTAAADEGTLQGLARGNRDYEAKFGHIFIVCATGKSAAEMLALLQARLPNDPETEWRIAAEEQKKITYIRLGKLEA